MERTIQDGELGLIILRVSTKAKRYTLKIADGQITGVIPYGGSEEKMLAFIEEKRSLLIRALKKLPAKAKYDESTVLNATTFQLHIFRTDRVNYYMKLEKNILHIACPQNTDFNKDSVQTTIRNLLGRALSHEANRFLPGRLQELALKHRFNYTGVKISKSKTSWGSCNVRKSINLSRSLMLLPVHLIDYVLLHELCHTLEMSHNTRFWKLLDNVTDNKAKALRQELKQYHTL